LDIVDYVLSDFTKDEEQKELDQIIKKCIDMLKEDVFPKPKKAEETNGFTKKDVSFELSEDEIRP